MEFSKISARLFLPVLASFCFQANGACTLGKIHFTPVILLGGGAAYSKVGQTQVQPSPLSLYDVLQDTYQATSHVQTKPLEGIFVGAEFATPVQWFSYQLGFGYYQINAFDANGVLYQASNLSMDYDNFNYKYQVDTHQYLLESKWMLNWKQVIHPYILLAGGLG